MIFHFGIPQIIYICLTVIGIFICARRHGRLIRQNLWYDLITSGMIYILLIWGGFFG